MAIDLYGPCPCGSGKKFKWCCQPIHVQINKAFQQDADGQHDAAMRIMDQLTTEHAGNPEAWGRKAQLLYENNRVEDAEKALDRAFELNPRYPFGYYLRGSFRREEGELPGALLLFRKAAELFDSEARATLGQLHALIADTELKLNRPVAARAALQMAARFDPTAPSYRQGLEQIFGPESRLPLAARREYTYQALPAGATEARRAAWQAALGAATTGKLADAARAFADLAGQDESNPATWYNLGLTRAWLGDNAGGLEALERYVALEADEARAAEAWALDEVLRTGFGMLEHADYVEHSAVFEVRDPQRFVPVLEALQRDRLLLVTAMREAEAMLVGTFLEHPPALTAEQAARQPARLRGHLLLSVSDAILRIWCLAGDALQALVEELRRRAGPGLGEPHLSKAPAPLAEVLDGAMVLPMAAGSEEQALQQVREGFERYFENQWPRQPLRALGGLPPADATGHGPLRKKLRGVIQFLQECAAASHLPYDFDRLRRSLGLLDGTPPAAGAAPSPDLGAADVAALAGLAPESLPDDQLEQAYQAALKLEACDLAARFGKVLVGRPPRPDHPDRFAVYNQLVQQLLGEGNTDAALDYVNEGEKADCEHNEGRRRNDYELRRAQIQAKRGEVELASAGFERLIQRAPAELKYQGSAAEAMLSARQAARAIRFAEQGLAGARQQNNRDSEQYFLELVAAAKRQGA
jgi:tetratricopeptide (TPR) repeat protein